MGPLILKVLFWFGTALYVVLAHFAVRRRMQKFFDRSCGGREWRRAFPVASNQEIREFLGIFVDGFSLSCHVLKFRPDDQLLQVYQAINAWSFGDSLDFETFAALLEDRYGVALGSIWRDDLT